MHTVRTRGQTRSVAHRLYRSMKVADDGLLQLGRSARTLGVRPQTDIPVDEHGIVRGGAGGMSVAPDSPMRLPAHRRPRALAGTGKDPSGSWTPRASTSSCAIGRIC